MSDAMLVVVLAALTPAELCLVSRERMARASGRAREAVQASAMLSGAVLGPLERDSNDAPLSTRGWHWSVSHAAGRVAGVVARSAVGVDLEPVRPRRAELVAAALDRRERELLADQGETAFVRGWTAKEAVLKKLGVGLGELSRCRLVAAPAPDVLELEHDGRAHRVHHALVDGAVVAVSVDGPDRAVVWRDASVLEGQR